MGDKARFDRVVQLLNHDNVNSYGPMHIAVEDGNMDDGNLDFVEEQMKIGGASDEEWELLRLLRQMHEDDRNLAWESAPHG